MKFLSYIKTSKDLSARHFQKKNKEKLQKRLVKGIQIFLRRRRKRKRQYAHEQYKNLSEEERNKKRKYSPERYRNLLEDEKQRLVKYGQKLF